MTQGFPGLEGSQECDGRSGSPIIFIGPVKTNRKEEKNTCDNNAACCIEMNDCEKAEE